MRILAVDTSAAASVAFLDSASGDLRELSEHHTRKHVEFIGPALAQILADARAANQLPELVVVGVGPGPFTGLRVGIAAGLGVGSALQIPVVGLPSHHALAFTAGQHGLTPPYLITTDARRKEVYATTMAALDAHGVPVIDREAAANLGAAAGREAEHVWPVDAQVVKPQDLQVPASVTRIGRGYEKYPAELGDPAATTDALLDPTAGALAQLAAVRLARGDNQFPAAVPWYLRAPDAAAPAPRVSRLR